MKLFEIRIDEYGIYAVTENNGELYLQLPHTPDSQHTLDRDDLTDDMIIKQAQSICDGHFGKGDRTLARLCYAGGQVYGSYTVKDGVYTTDTGDAFTEHPYADYYKVEMYERAAIDCVDGSIHESM